MKKGLLFIFLVGLIVNSFPCRCGESFGHPKETTVVKEIDIRKPRPIVDHKEVSKKSNCPKKIDEYGYSNEELVLMARITIAEAEGESEYGKRLVIDTILNRKDSDNFPSTINDVIFQPNRFTCINNGRFDRVKVDGDTVDLVVQEIKNRSNYDTVYFSAGGYSAYGTPLFKEGNHYFSSN